MTKIDIQCEDRLCTFIVESDVPRLEDEAAAIIRACQYANDRSYAGLRSRVKRNMDAWNTDRRVKVSVSR